MKTTKAGPIIDARYTVTNGSRRPGRFPWAAITTFALTTAIMVVLGYCVRWLVYDELPAGVSGYLAVAIFFLSIGFLLGMRHQQTLTAKADHNMREFRD